MSSNKKISWYDFALLTNGKYIEEIAWHSDKTEIEYLDFKITFDSPKIWSEEYSKRMTRVIVPYVSDQDFSFKIRKTNVIRSVAKLLGGQDVEIGFDDFDQKFIIKSNQEDKLKTIFRNNLIRDILLNQKKFYLEISKFEGVWGEKLPKNEFELSFYVDGKIQDPERLKTILTLFKELINEMVALKLMNPK